MHTKATYTSTQSPVSLNRLQLEYFILYYYNTLIILIIDSIDE